MSSAHRAHPEVEALGQRTVRVQGSPDGVEGRLALAQVVDVEPLGQQPGRALAIPGGERSPAGQELKAAEGALVLVELIEEAEGFGRAVGGEEGRRGLGGQLPDVRAERVGPKEQVGGVRVAGLGEIPERPRVLGEGTGAGPGRVGGFGVADCPGETAQV